MLKWIGVICVLAGCIGLGVYQSYLVKLRLENLADLKRSLICLRGEIEFGRTPLPEAFSCLGRRSHGDVSVFFQKLSRKLIPGTTQGNSMAELWEEAAKETFVSKTLAAKDFKEWLELGQTIGYLDSKMQVDTINLYIERLEQSLETGREEKSAKVRLYNLLGVMAGVFITIMIL